MTYPVNMKKAQFFFTKAITFLQKEGREGFKAGMIMIKDLMFLYGFPNNFGLHLKRHGKWHDTQTR